MNDGVAALPLLTLSKGALASTPQSRPEAILNTFYLMTTHDLTRAMPVCSVNSRVDR